MAKYCQNCGSEIIEDSSFCDNCGAKVDESNTPTQSRPTINVPSSIEYRNIATCIILSFVTCGIYGIIWLIDLAEDVNTLSNDHKTSGAMVFVYSLTTCGIYGFIWYYNAGKKMNQAGLANGKNISDNSTLYLILLFLGLGIVNMALIQNDINQFAQQQQ